MAPAAVTFGGAAIAPFLGVLLGGLLAVATTQNPLWWALVFAFWLLDPLQLTASTFLWLVANRAWRAHDEYVAILPAGAPRPEGHRVVLAAAASVITGLYVIFFTALVQVVSFAALGGQ